jgi:hypothetical protein
LCGRLRCHPFVFLVDAPPNATRDDSSARRSDQLLKNNKRRTVTFI